MQVRKNGYRKCGGIDCWITEGWEWRKPVNHEIYINAQNGQWLEFFENQKA